MGLKLLQSTGTFLTTIWTVPISLGEPPWFFAIICWYPVKLLVSLLVSQATKGNDTNNAPQGH
jgi:hypothetical protein